MTVLTEAYLLKKSSRNDFDRQYTLYTKDLGKITALAKGALKISSKLAPHLEFFYLVEVMVAPGRAFYRLAGAKIRAVRLLSASDEKRLIIANFFLSVIDILMVDQCEDRTVFDLLDNFFLELSIAADDRQVHLVLNQSLYDLLSHLGYQPKLIAKTQIELTRHLHRLVLEAGEKEIPCFFNLNRLLLVTDC
jgi:DNA repair protein RecO (recombination protein O)